MVIGFDFLYIVFAFFSTKIFDRLRFADIIIYIVYGFFGLFFIEWFLIGNSPLQNPDANQFIMFSYWGGAVLTARIFTDEKTRKLKKAILWFFIPYSIISIIGGNLIPLNERLGPIVLMAIIGYGLMNIFYILYFIKKIRKPV